MTTDYSPEARQLADEITAKYDDPFSRGSLAHMRETFPDQKAVFDQYEDHFYAPELLAELLTVHSARVVEVDADDLHELRGRSFADVNGLPVLVFPYGQDPRERLTLARELLARHTA